MFVVHTVHSDARKASPAPPQPGPADSAAVRGRGGRPPRHLRGGLKTGSCYRRGSVTCFLHLIILYNPHVSIYQRRTWTWSPGPLSWVLLDSSLALLLPMGWRVLEVKGTGPQEPKCHHSGYPGRWNLLLKQPGTGLLPGSDCGGGSHQRQGWPRSGCLRGCGQSWDAPDGVSTPMRSLSYSEGTVGGKEKHALWTEPPFAFMPQAPQMSGLGLV